MKAKTAPIRRKFLLLQSPSSLVALKGIDMEEGFIVSSSLRDLRLRRKDKSYFISFREKKASFFHSKEIKITKANFEALWSFTEGKRICSKRYLLTVKKLKMKIDCFLGEHAPLQLVEVFFPTSSASKSFQKPTFFGEEITGQEMYDTEEMALHGVPEAEGMCQIGILPYVFKNRKLHVLLVTSSSGNRWIIPKGHQEPDMTRHEVAIMEAVEEGGVLGTLQQECRVRCQMANGRFLQLYAMKISKLLNSWPEEHLRLRRLLPLSEALALVDDPEMVRAIRRLAVQLKKQ